MNKQTMMIAASAALGVYLAHKWQTGALDPASREGSAAAATLNPALAGAVVGAVAGALLVK